MTNDANPSAEAAVEPVADLIERLKDRCGNRALLCAEAAASLSQLSTKLENAERERDEALDRIEELESEAETVSAEFEGDCWKAMRSLLSACEFNWRDVDTDGVTAEDAREYIATTLDEIEKGEARQRSRAESAEQERDELRAKLEATMELDALVARLKALSGPDREVDLAIAQTLVPDVIVLRHDRDSGDNRQHTYWEYTGSIDAAVALVERKLPGWRWGVSQLGDALLYRRADNEQGYDLKISQGANKPPAIALLIALLSALSHSSSKGESRE